MEIIKRKEEINNLKMDILYSALNVIFDNGWIPIVQMKVVEMTSRIFASVFKQKYRLSQKYLTAFSRYESLEEKIIVETMAVGANVEPDVIRKMVHGYLKGQCFVSGSIVVSAVVGERPYNNADIDLFVQCPLDANDLEIFVMRIQALIEQHLKPQGFEFDSILYGPDLGVSLQQIYNAHNYEGYKFKEKISRSCSWKDSLVMTEGVEYNLTSLLQILTLTKTENIEGR
jgi:hypothetical protein